MVNISPYMVNIFPYMVNIFPYIMNISPPDIMNTSPYMVNISPYMVVYICYSDGKAESNLWVQLILKRLELQEYDMVIPTLKQAEKQRKFTKEVSCFMI